MSFESNTLVSKLFQETATLLKEQSADDFICKAYKQAADQMTKLDVDLRCVWEQGGRKGLEALPTIGSSLAASIEEILGTGHYRALDRLAGHVHPEHLFCKLPGIGEVLAARIHNELHVETLEELEMAAHDGRLAGVHGISAGRSKAILLALGEYLGNSKRRSSRARPGHSRSDGEETPSLSLLLAVDRSYRDRAEKGTLHCIAPHRFNASGAAWLPVWHTHREGWAITAMYSNSARAHTLGKTRDWVVLVLEMQGHEEQCTVVTEYHGALQGLRVVRGREKECHEYYEKPLPADVAAVRRIRASTNTSKSKTVKGD